MKYLEDSNSKYSDSKYFEQICDCNSNSNIKNKTFIDLLAKNKTFIDLLAKNETFIDLLKKNETFIDLLKKNETFIDLLKKNYPKEYNDLFVIKKDLLKIDPLKKYISKNIYDTKKHKKKMYNIKIYDKKKEYNPEILQTDIIQFGNGKGQGTWKKICNFFQKEIDNNNNLSITISKLSDKWENRTENSKWAGIIFWHQNFKREIERNNDNDSDDESVDTSTIDLQKSIYVLIQDTNKWSGDHFRRQGSGMVHDYLFKQVIGESKEDAITDYYPCCSGFSMMPDEDGKLYAKFASNWLNASATIPNCSNGPSKMTNVGESIIIILSLYQYIYNGVESVFPINFVPDPWRDTNSLPDDYTFLIDDNNNIKTFWLDAIEANKEDDCELSQSL